MTIYKNADTAYSDLVRNVMFFGSRKENRTGIDTISTFNANYTLDLRNGFPLLTTKTISWKNIVAELIWFLSGETSNAILKKHGCRFWDSWTDHTGEISAGYGQAWRDFRGSETIHACNDSWEEVSPNDQIAFVIKELLINPMSRRLVVSAWQPNQAQPNSLPPCHCMFIFNVQKDEKGKDILCCHLTQRSADIGLGVPYNIASYALLTHIISKIVQIPVGYFGHTLVDAHIYCTPLSGKFQGDRSFDHVAALNLQLGRTPYAPPHLILPEKQWTFDTIKTWFNMDTEQLLREFQLFNYQSHPNIYMKAAV